MANMQSLAEEANGAVAIEFAIVMPIFILVLSGIIVYGLYFGVAHAVQELAAEAARASIAGLSAPERETLARRQIAETIGQYPFLRREFATVTASADPGDANRFMVTVRYDASHLGLAGFAQVLPTPPDGIERTSVIRRGGF